MGVIYFILGALAGAALALLVVSRELKKVPLDIERRNANGCSDVSDVDQSAHGVDK